MDKKTVGKFLRELRKEKNLTQAAFAEKFSAFCGIEASGGFSCAAISKWERGESLPNIQNLIDIAKFYEITVDEVLEGCHYAPIDYNQLYLGEYYRKTKNRSGPFDFVQETGGLLADLIEIQIYAENRYRTLLPGLGHNAISRIDEEEFDFLCISFFKQYSVIENGEQKIKPFTSDALKNIKLDVKKITNSLSACSDEELLFEINRRYCVCNCMPMEGTAVNMRFANNRCDPIEYVALFHSQQAYYKFVDSLLPWDKDVLLAEALRYTEYLKDIYEEEITLYYGEDDVKGFIKMLIECGATINHTIRYTIQRETINIAEELARLYAMFYAPTVVYDTAKKQFAELDYYPTPDTPVATPSLKKEYEDLEQRLLDGENELEYQYTILRGKSIYEITYQEYLQGRDEKLTHELYENLQVLDINRIKSEYFVESEVIK